MSFEDFIRSNYSVVDVRDSDEIRICCPNCGDDKYHGYVNTEKNVFHCFKCEVSQSPFHNGFSAYKFLSKFHRLQHREILEVLKKLDWVNSRLSHTYRYDVSDFDPDKKDEKSSPDLDLEVSLPEGWPLERSNSSFLGSKALRYLKKRFGDKGIDWCSEFGFTYCSKGSFTGRLILPVYTDEKVSYFQARLFYPENGNPKYLNPRVERALFMPYGVDKEIFLCEGYFDALSIGKGGVACFGSNLTTKQKNQLIKLKAESLTICFDSDEAGIRGAEKVGRELEGNYKSLYVVTNLKGKDPADFKSRAKEVMLKNRKKFDFSLFLP